MTASAYGLPDAGIASFTQMLDRVSTLARTANASVIADADTGYDGLLNVHQQPLRGAPWTSWLGAIFARPARYVWRGCSSQPLSLLYPTPRTEA